LLATAALMDRFWADAERRGWRRPTLAEELDQWERQGAAVLEFSE
jgi:hypothetical protein